MIFKKFCTSCLLFTFIFLNPIYADCGKTKNYSEFKLEELNRPPDQKLILALKKKFYSQNPQIESSLDNFEILKLAFQSQKFKTSHDPKFDLHFLGINWAQELSTRSISQEQVCHLHHLGFFKFVFQKNHSFYQGQDLLLDEALGLAPLKVHREESYSKESKTWATLHPSLLNTNYASFAEILKNESPPPGSIFVDMGSGQGRLGFMIGAAHPNLSYIGIEFHSERIANSLRTKSLLDYKNIDFQQGDFTHRDFIPPAGDYFYFYRPSSDSNDNFLGIEKLKTIADKKKIRLLFVQVGDSKSLISKFPWLRYLGKKKFKNRHFAHYDIYESRPAQ